VVAGDHLYVLGGKNDRIGGPVKLVPAVERLRVKIGADGFAEKRAWKYFTLMSDDQAGESEFLPETHKCRSVPWQLLISVCYDASACKILTRLCTGTMRLRSGFH
jgi:hypothetical protein